MDDFDRKKLTEIVLYILQKTGGTDQYHLFKILYFAQMKHLAQWGVRIVSDDFYALPYGPVPTMLYDAVKEISPNGYITKDLAKELDQVVCFAGSDAPNVLLAKRCFNESFLSKSETEVLDIAIEENAKLTFGELKDKSHDAAWSEANAKTNERKIISPVSMAKVMQADEAMLEYIREQLEIDSALL